MDKSTGVQSQPKRCLCGWVVLAAALFGTSSAIAQDFDATFPPQLASSAERLMMEQVVDLKQSGQFSEALGTLKKLYDQSRKSLVEAGAGRQVVTQRAQRYIPLRQWCQSVTRELLEQQPEQRAVYMQQMDGLAAAALASLQVQKDPAEAKQLATRYRLTASGNDLTFYLADLYLERGWNLAAISAIMQVAPELRYSAPKSSANALSAPSGEASRTWWCAWQTCRADSERELLRAIWREQVGGQPGGITEPRLVEALKRLLIAAAMQPQCVDQSAVRAWVQVVAEYFAEPQRADLLKSLDASAQWSSWPVSTAWTTFAANATRTPVCKGRYDLAAWPEWQQPLERYTANSDRTTASKPRVGEYDRGTLAYHPVVAHGKVYVNEMNRIRAYDLKSGQPWPKVVPALPLFDSRIHAAAYIPLGYPLVGTPRGTLALADDALYARMGTPITGWANREAAEDGGSLSYLVGLDLKRQGSVMRGFPLRLTPPEFNGAEFEGCPLVWGEQLLATIVERDNVGLRRSVAAFDRFSGELVWRSAVLAVGTVEGSDRANLITHQLLTMAGGRVFYNTNLGTIACLDPLTGETEWLTRYQRYDQLKHTHPSPVRFRYRDLTPCVVAQGLVYCMPQDCPELFALDATTGDMVWSSDDVEVEDAVHVLGISGDSLLVSGDRLIWLDRCRGGVLDRFPGSTTPGSLNALPNPRGLGRGAISGGVVYWPTAGEVFVFDADISKQSRKVPPAIKQRHRIDSRGSEGGNLMIAADHLVFCGPSRIMVFKGE